LVDATYEPVNTPGISNLERDDIIQRDYPLLRADLANLLPERSTPLVLIKKNVCQILEPKLHKDGFNVLNRGNSVYFPSNGRQPDFHRQFRTILKSSGITIYGQN
jgi:hypothetical protein